MTKSAWIASVPVGFFLAFLVYPLAPITNALDGIGRLLGVWLLATGAFWAVEQGRARFRWSVEVSSILALLGAGWLTFFFGTFWGVILRAIF